MILKITVWLDFKCFLMYDVCVENFFGTKVKNMEKIDILSGAAGNPSSLGGNREAAAWSAMREQDLPALEAMMDQDGSWLLGLREEGSSRSPEAYCLFLHRHDALRVLLNAGANPDGPDGERTLLTSSVESRCPECVDLLIQAGADLDGEDGRCITPLVAASSAKRPAKGLECAAALLDAGASPDAASTLGYFPLAMAAQEDQAEMSRLLVGRGADLDRHAGDGYTALFYAVDHRARAAVEALLRMGADHLRRARVEVEEGAARDLTPFEFARGLGDTATATLLYAFAEASALSERIGARGRASRSAAVRL